VTCMSEDVTLTSDVLEFQTLFNRSSHEFIRLYTGFGVSTVTSIPK